MADNMKDKMKGAIDTGAERAKQGVDRASDAVQGNRGNTGGIMDTAKETAQSAVNAVSDFAGQARDRVEGWAGDVGDAAQHAGERAQRWAGDAYDVTADTMGEFGRELTSMVRRYPIPALLVGFGVGLLLGRAARA
jgi:hypothetical protein